MRVTLDVKDGEAVDNILAAYLAHGFPSGLLARVAKALAMHASYAEGLAEEKRDPWHDWFKGHCQEAHVSVEALAAKLDRDTRESGDRL